MSILDEAMTPVDERALYNAWSLFCVMSDEGFVEVVEELQQQGLNEQADELRRGRVEFPEAVAVLRQMASEFDSYDDFVTASKRKDWAEKWPVDHPKRKVG